AKDVFFLPSQDYDVRVPGRRVVLFQASPDVYYQQTVMPQATPFSDNLTQLILVRRYAEPGKTYVVPFARGPVGPGIERPRFYTTVSRHRGHLSAYLPLFSGADSGTDSWIARADGSWSLHQGRHVLAHGANQISFNVAVPPGRRRYVLRAD